MGSMMFSKLAGIGGAVMAGASAGTVGGFSVGFAVFMGLAAIFAFLEGMGNQITEAIKNKTN